MSTFVLVHGAWHGAWCWYKIIPLIERNGHKVVAVDLPSHGRDKTPPEKITLRDYVDCVCRVLDAETEPVILVGHSMGGVVITQVAEERPDKIKRLVYLTAFLLQNGETLLQVLGDQTLVLPNLVMPYENSPFSVKEDAIKEVFYADCPDSDITLAKLLLVPQAPEPFNARVQTSPTRFGRVPRVYITCTKDNAIFPVVQERMYTNLPCERVIKMETSHSPFFSAPEQLTKNLLSLI
ncbi:alpha/beta fold hydrolase [Neomoorella carbonis]|uniref:alpha/beta fold hydrolase n=1 Tax=Neomoorella carbonis TaxID=3062783 RepID=UPI00325590E8